MAKSKKKVSADLVNSRRNKTKQKKALNPFEVHVNKEKLRVLGKKEKNDKGLPGASRSKAIQKRKSTLLQEYKLQNKSNKFLDKRIGEKNLMMTEEDKSMARFTAVRVKTHKKENIFNLGDDEVLTHRGQTLSEIEKFDDPRSDYEENLEEEGKGNLHSDFVEAAHFGGGLLTNTGKEGFKTHKELIDELIAESKRRKVEQQKTKEATLELTEKLDAEWKDLLPLVNKNKRGEETEIKKTQIDDYDKMMRELRFEARGVVSDRLKTEDEIAKEEKEKLEQLEKERLERMKGFINETDRKINHRSADDLDDDIVYTDDADYMLSYNAEGESNVEVNMEVGEKSKGNDDEVESENETDDEESSSEDDLSDLKASDTESEDNEVKKDLSRDQEEKKHDFITNQTQTQKVVNEKVVVESGSDDDLADLKAIDTESKNEGVKENSSNNREVENHGSNKNQMKTKKEVNGKVSVDHQNLQENIKADLLKRKEIMEQARKELPYTFYLPDSYEHLQQTLENQFSNHQSVIIERMIKCNHPSLAVGNKDKLSLLFAYILQYVNDLFVECTETNTLKNNFEIFKAIMPQIYDLAQVNPENTHNSVLEVIKEKHEEYRKKKTKYPGLEVLVFFKLVSVLFSTSDFRHQIVTPCLVFIEQMLTKCKVRTKQDIAYGIFLVTLVLEYTTMSRRYLPASINFLSSVLHSAIPKSTVRLIKVLPPFKATSSLLVLLKKFSNSTFKTLQMDSADLVNLEIDEDFKVRVLYTTVKLLEEFHAHFKDYSSNIEIFERGQKYIEMIPLVDYPKQVRDCLEEFLNVLRKTKDEKKLYYIEMESMKPKALRLYEPKIVEVYDGKRRKAQSKEKAELQKLQHKLKKERKGALREIRRDNSFLGRVKIQQQIQSDKERREKVKRIYAEAAAQQSELNAMDRKNKRKKK